mgnify:CR=1 FL=1
MSKKIAELEKEVGLIDHEPNQKQIDGDLAAQYRAEAAERKAAKVAQEASKTK